MSVEDIVRDCKAKDIPVALLLEPPDGEPNFTVEGRVEMEDGMQVALRLRNGSLYSVYYDFVVEAHPLVVG